MTMQLTFMVVRQDWLWHYGTQFLQQPQGVGAVTLFLYRSKQKLREGKYVSKVTPLGAKLYWGKEKKLAPCPNPNYFCRRDLSLGHSEFLLMG